MKQLPISDNNIWVVMAVYNGARFLPEQLASLKNQSVPPTGIVISDDSSTDDSLKIITAFFENWAECTLKLTKGPSSGYSSNFFHALSLVPDHAEFVALCDQDDVWFPEKISRALVSIKSQSEHCVPSLYGAATLHCDENLVALGPSRKFDIVPSLSHALTQNFAGGNTMVLNGKAFQIVNATRKFAQGVKVHDWWIYQLIAAANGRIIYDPEPCLFYRQHSQNLIGSNDGSRAMMARFRAMLRGTYRDWNTCNFSALSAANNFIAPVSVQTVNQLLDMRQESVLARLQLVRDLRLKRRGLLGQFGLWLSVLLNRF